MSRIDAPMYRQIADKLRKEIANGHYAPGERLPPEAELVKLYGVARETVRKAIVELRSEGLAVARPGHGTFVLQHGPRTSVSLRPGDEVTARMPTPQERRRLKTGEGVPVMIVNRGGRATVRAACDLMLVVPPCRRERRTRAMSGDAAPESGAGTSHECPGPSSS